MSDTNFTGVVIGFVADVGLALLLNYFRKKSLKAANEIQETKVYAIDNNLLKELQNLPDKTVPYGCVEGVTAATNKLRSHYKDDVEGVIRNIALIEHKSKRNNGVWTDVQNVIRDAVDIVPFYLQGLFGWSNDTKVHVAEPKSASFLMDELTTTYDNYESNKPPLIQRGLDRIFGEVPKGLHEYEKMLVIGTQLFGIGKIKLENNKITLQPPDNGQRYILTQKTKEEIIKYYSSQSSLIKVFLGISCAVGFVLAAYIVRKLYKRWKTKRDHERMFEQARQARMAARATARNADNSGNEVQECVICLTNPREVVLLNCGHICLCIDCAQALPRPMQCPVCRQNVERFVNAYIS